MSFFEWVRNHPDGIVELAKKIGVKRVTIHRWVTLGYSPNARSMHSIRKVSKNKVTYEMIVDDVLRQSRKIRNQNEKEG